MTETNKDIDEQHSNDTDRLEGGGMSEDVFSTIKEEGPVSHTMLCERLGLEWYELQPYIRELRSEKQIRITLDRKYDVW